MDKRLLFLMLLALVGSGSFLAYRKLYYKPEGIKYTIKPLGVIQTGDSIAYNDQTAGATRWKWDFGDGEFSAEQSGHHTYLVPGKFTVMLTAYGPFGVQQKSDEVTVTSKAVANVPAGPTIIGPEQAKVGAAAQFASSVHADNYEWKVEGDAAMAAQKTATATYTFKTAGQHTVVLTTHKPDAVIHHNVLVAAAEAPAKPAAATAAIPMPPQQHAAQQPAKPKTQHPHQNNQQGNKLEDLGDGVEIKK